MIAQDLMLGLLDRAMQAEIGIEVDSSNNTNLRHKLYEFRKTLGTSAYDELMLFITSKGKLWIVKKTTEMPKDA